MVRLVSTADGRVLWTGDSQTRALGEMVVVQDEIGCSVAASLKAVLCGTPPHRAGTADLAAYDAYLQGVYWRRNSDVKKAAAFFAQATAADPAYALAWAGLADAWAIKETASRRPSSWPRCGRAAARPDSDRAAVAWGQR